MNDQQYTKPDPTTQHPPPEQQPYPEQPPPPYPSQQPAYPPQQPVYPPQQPVYPPQQTYPPQTYTNPQPTGYPTGPVTGHTATVVVSPPQPTTFTTVVRPSFRDYPILTRCPSCNQDVMTRIQYEVGMMVWLAAGVICFIGLSLGCCLIPFCIDQMKDVTHHCPNCNTYLGKYERLS